MFWFGLLIQLQCCGLRSKLDWVPLTPDSCCPSGTKTCTFVDAYSRSCLEAFQELSSSTGMLAYFILGVAGIEVSGQPAAF